MGVGESLSSQRRALNVLLAISIYILYNDHIYIYIYKIHLYETAPMICTPRLKILSSIQKITDAVNDRALDFFGVKIYEIHAIFVKLYI